MEIKINPAFKELIRPLTEEEYQLLEQKIRTEGVRDKLTVWNGTLLDGHNRYEIAKKLGIENALEYSEMEFADENEAKIWILQNQLGRRNLDIITKIQLAEMMDPLLAEKAKKNSLANLKQNAGNTEVTKSSPRGKTRSQIAKLADISEDKYRKAKAIMEEGTPEQIFSVRSGEKTVNTVYREMQPGTKTCRVCGEEKPASRCHDNTCLDCYNKKRTAQKREQRGGVRVRQDIVISESTKAQYSIENFQLEFKANADTYVELAESIVTAHYSWLWEKTENKKIAIAALDDVIAALANLKGVL